MALVIYRKPLGLIIQSIKSLSYDNGKLLVDLNNQNNSLNSLIILEEYKTKKLDDNMLESFHEEDKIQVTPPQILLSDSKGMINQLNSVIDSLYSLYLNEHPTNQMIIDPKSKLSFFAQNGVINSSLY